MSPLSFALSLLLAALSVVLFLLYYATWVRDSASREESR